MDASALWMMGIWMIGSFLADREKDGLRFVHAMRLCTLRLSDMACCPGMKYPDVLMYICLYGNTQQRQFTEILHTAANKISSSATPQAMDAFIKVCSKKMRPGMVHKVDCAAFQSLLYNLDRSDAEERLKCIDAAHAYLGKRECELAGECAVRANLIRALSVACGAAAYVMLARI